MSRQNKLHATAKGQTTKAKNLYIPLELSRTILKNIQCPYRIVDSDDQMYVKAYHGQASIEFSNGATYKGKIYNGLIQGEGTLCWNSSHSYTGTFVNNKAHGKGRMQAGSTEYEGSFYRGMRHGTGTLKNETSVYEGQWRKGKMEGIGTLIFKDDERYEGHFSNNAKHGIGSYYYSDGSLYSGEWRENQRHGKGKLKSAVFCYEGDWQNDQPKGQGIVIWYDRDGKKSLRDRYEGSIDNNIRTGYGVFYYSNLSVYAGMWSNNCKNGPGYFLSENGKYTSVIYKNDRIESVIVESTIKSHCQLNGIDNHYSSLLDSALPLSQKERENLSLVCLRFNSQLKSWYRDHSTVSNERYVSFMCASDFWEFIRQYKLLEIEDSLPSFNRMLMCNLTTRVMLNILPSDNFEFVLERTKCIQDYDELYFVYQASNIQQADQLQKQQKPIQMKKIDIHCPNRQISFREFVDGLVRLAIRKAEKNGLGVSKTFNQVLERCETHENSKKRSDRRESVTHSSIRSGFLFMAASKENLDQFNDLFERLSSNAHQRLAFQDRTITLQELARLVRLDSLDSTTKYKFYKYFTKPYDLSGGELSDTVITRLASAEICKAEFIQFLSKWKCKYTVDPLSADESKLIIPRKYLSDKMALKKELQARRQQQNEELERRLQCKREEQRLQQQLDRKNAESEQPSIMHCEEADRSFTSLSSDF